MDKLAMLRKAMESVKSGGSAPKSPSKASQLADIAKEIRAAASSKDDAALAAALKSFLAVAREE